MAKIKWVSTLTIVLGLVAVPVFGDEEGCTLSYSIPNKQVYVRTQGAGGGEESRKWFYDPAFNSDMGSSSTLTLSGTGTFKLKTNVKAPTRSPVCSNSVTLERAAGGVIFLVVDYLGVDSECSERRFKAMAGDSSVGQELIQQRYPLQLIEGSWDDYWGANQ